MIGEFCLLNSCEKQIYLSTELKYNSEAFVGVVSFYVT